MNFRFDRPARCAWASLLLITPLGFATKFYTGPGRHWVNKSLGGVLYEIFWCLVVFLFTRKAAAWKIALGVFIATSILEVLQLFHPPFLQFLRSFFIGRTLLGTTFVPSDFFYYVIGCLLGWAWLRTLKRLTPSSRPKNR